MLLLAVLASACGQAGQTPGSARTARRSSSARAEVTVRRDPILARLGLPPVAAGSKLPGYLMIGGWVDRFDRLGHLLWSIRTPTTYPSDAQLLPSGNVLVAGYNTPGRIDVINPHGRILWTYGPASGRGALGQPSLAVALPNGTIAATDDWHHRVVLINRASKRIVWQYGHDGVPGSAPGHLNKPDGLELLP